MATASDVYERTDQSIDSDLIDAAVKEVKRSKASSGYKLEWSSNCAEILDMYYADYHSKVYTNSSFS